MTINSINAKDYDTQLEYWNAHLTLIDEMVQMCKPYKLCVSIEDYLLYADSAKSQINSTFETPQLIGVLKMWCYLKGIKVLLRNASVVKKRWADHILVHEGYIEERNGHYYLPNTEQLLCKHERDALRHAIHPHRYELKEETE